MAAVNAALGDHEKSKVLYMSVLATQERQYGQWYPEIATSLSNLAMVRIFHRSEILEWFRLSQYLTLKVPRFHYNFILILTRV
jgi:hypothetical protein